MNIQDKKKILIISIAALIITFIINFPHFISTISSDDHDFKEYPLSEDTLRQDLNFPKDKFFQDTTIFPLNNKKYSDFNPRQVHSDDLFKAHQIHIHRGKMKFRSPRFLIYQIVLYFLYAFIIMLIGLDDSQKVKSKNRYKWLLIIIGKYIIVTALFYSFEKIVLQQLILHFNFGLRPGFDAVLFSRYLFVLVIAILGSTLMRILENKNNIQIENERLRSENLQIRYNALTNQMNPHFFFNSLNSLQYLLIEGEQKKSVIYISELSTVFRYILQSSKKELVDLAEELDFLKAYRYLLDIRFENKIQFKIDIDESQIKYKIPVLSIQPLVENAINHNVCSFSKPLIITISIKDHYLVISNNKNPKINSKGGGIGLVNLKKRFLLLLNKEIVIQDNADTFSVHLPLKN